MNFIENLENNVKTTTENGAVAYATTGSKLLDFFYKVSSFRKNPVDYSLFDEAYYQDKAMTLRFLLFLRDVREGMGERDTFRKLLLHLTEIDMPISNRFLYTVALHEFGRWDDYIYLFANTKDESLKRYIAGILLEQLDDDLYNYSNGKPYSLLAKWMPSINTSSKKTVAVGNELRKYFRMSPSQYRKTLSKLRKGLDVLEVNLSSNKWDKVDYSHVPSLANIKYKDSFLKHDFDRRNEYLIDVARGKKKINANSMFLYDIIHAYEKEADVNGYYMPPADSTLESLWASQNKPSTFADTLVVRDGSFSMTERVSKNVSAMEIGDSIALYCAKNNTGVFKDKIMAFSNNPKMITVNCNTLRDNIEKLMKNTACSTTNVESVFDLILKTAKKCNARQNDMPKNVLIISDMQFNAAMCDKDAFGFSLRNQNVQEDDTLFENIEKKYNACGYELPKLIFWNVSCYNDGTVPIQSSRNGVILLSGFSKELVDMVCCSELDPYKAFCRQLNKPRYDVVEEIFKYC